MAKRRITRLARRDLLGIGRYTRARWGKEQRDRYLGQLYRRFDDLGDDPYLIGSVACDELRPGYRRFHEGRHMIFFRVRPSRWVEIIRVLHDRMLPELHLFENDDDD